MTIIDIMQKLTLGLTSSHRGKAGGTRPYLSPTQYQALCKHSMDRIVFKPPAQDI